MDSWDANESSMIGVRAALVGRPLPDMGRAPAETGLGGLPADAGLEGLGLQRARWLCQYMQSCRRPLGL